jgi:hypothetical protein
MSAVEGADHRIRTVSAMLLSIGFNLRRSESLGFRYPEEFEDL